MDNLAHSEIFALTLVIGTYLTSLALYKKVHISLLHPLLTTIFVIIVVLEVLGIQYESFQQSSHLIHFMLGPSVVALGYVLYEQIQYLKGNVVSILTSVFVGAIVGIVSVIIIGKLMGADQALIATLQPKSVTMGIAEKAGGIPSLTAVIVVAVGIFGSIVGPIVMRVLGIDSHIAKGLALGASSHGVGTAAAIQIGAIEGALSGLAIGLMGIMTAVLVPVIRLICNYFSI